jgi:two-component system chemotaxis response regulator CheB
MTTPTTRDAASAIVIGASAGGVDALKPLLSALTPRSPPVLVVVHIPRQRPSLLATIFSQSCPGLVREAVDKMPLRPGEVYFAPPDYHLLVERGPGLALSIDDPVQYCRPSIDVLFESAADVFGPDLVGIVLTGNNDDGAAGLAAVRRQSGRAIVQDPETAQGSTMPAAALRRVPDAQALALPEIARVIASLVMKEPL